MEDFRNHYEVLHTNLTVYACEVVPALVLIIDNATITYTCDRRQLLDERVLVVAIFC